jgi:hypothetical protein
VKKFWQPNAGQQERSPTFHNSIRIVRQKTHHLACQYEGEEAFQRGTPTWLFQDVSALSGIQAPAQTDGPFDSGSYVPLIMVIALRPKILKTMDVRIRVMIQ